MYNKHESLQMPPIPLRTITQVVPVFLVFTFVTRFFSSEKPDSRYPQCAFSGLQCQESCFGAPVCTSVKDMLPSWSAVVI